MDRFKLSPLGAITVNDNSLCIKIQDLSERERDTDIKFPVTEELGNCHSKLFKYSWLVSARTGVNSCWENEIFSGQKENFQVYLYQCICL